MRISELLEKEYSRKKILNWVLFFIIFAVGITYLIFHNHVLFNGIRDLYHLLSPFLNGLLLAFVLNIFVSFFETKIFSDENCKKNHFAQRNKRGISVCLALFLIASLLAAVLILVVPELIRSVSAIKELTEEMPEYLNGFTVWLSDELRSLGVEQNLDEWNINWSTIFEKIISFVSKSGKTLLSILVNITSGIVNVILSLVFAVYLLLNKEMILRNLKRILFAFFPHKIAVSIAKTGALANTIFKSYATAQFIEAFILGSLCYLGMVIIRLPYALLVAVIVGITSLIPIFGTYIGGAIGTLVILMVHPLSALWFLVFLIFLQSIESNLIYPKLVGDSVGLPGLWVLTAIFLFGQLFGFMGMLIGVPTFSVLYTLLKNRTTQRLKRKELDYDQIEHCLQYDGLLSEETPIMEQQVETKDDIDQMK